MDFGEKCLITFVSLIALIGLISLGLPKYVYEQLQSCPVATVIQIGNCRGSECRVIFDNGASEIIVMPILGQKQHICL